MLKDLILYNLPANCELSDFKNLKNHFVLETCQRTLILTHFEKLNLEKAETIKGEKAYHYLLEVICGLKSRLIGENEIVSQFKKAYQNYTSLESKSSELLLILEKLFRDAKQVRTQYLTGISQKTYASITRKEFVQKNKAKKIIILGSGQLAQDLINQFVKHCEIIVCARNQKKAAELQNIERCQILEWDQLETISNFPYIANTIGFNGVLLDEEFFNEWRTRNDQRLFIDLGGQSCIETSLNSEHGVLRLDDILNEGAILEDSKKEKITQAQDAIRKVVKQRTDYLQKKLNVKKSFMTHGTKPAAYI